MKNLLFIAIFLLMFPFYGCEDPEPPQVITADFFTEETTVEAGTPVEFFDNSTNNPAKWWWDFHGAIPKNPEEPNPVVSYQYPGTFDVRLYAYRGVYENGNGYGRDDTVKWGYMTVWSIDYALDAYFPFTGHVKDESEKKQPVQAFGGQLIEDRKGVSDNAYKLDGLDDHIQITSPFTLGLKPYLTISFWINTVSTANTDSAYIFSLAMGNERGKKINIYTINEELIYQSFGRFNSVWKGNTKLKNGKWQQVVISVNEDIVIYLDGNFQGVFNGSDIILDVIRKSFIGCTSNENGDKTNFWQGEIDDIRLYNRGLTSFEVKKLYERER